MNPPFVPWERMPPADQEVVNHELGGLKRFRADLAMAFIWKGVKTLSSNSSLATVLPAPLFETDSGEKWRDAIKSRAELLFLGRFAGYGFFRGSTVEPGMLVLKGRTSASPRESAVVRVLAAKSGSEDAALCALRRGSERSPSPADWDVFSVQEQSLTSASWMPRFRHSMQLVETLAASGVASVADLFDVHQGIRTGDNKAFVLSAAELASLPKKERLNFKPIASNSTIRDGTISPDEFVFFPYDSSGLTITTEEELAKRVPRYFERWLAPGKTRLASRRGIDPNQWWRLTRPRSWQFRKQPKLTSTYFGYRGSFAYDEAGEFAVLQGYAWLWKRKKLQGSPSFDESSLPWGYLAILNSPVFETLLESSCPRVQGGQFNLSTRFVDGVFLPDLADSLRYTGALIEKLARLGRRIHSGDMPELDALDELARQAYGIPATS